MILYWILFIGQAWAEEGGHGAQAAHDAHAVPWSSIFVQTFNISFLVILLFFVLRKTVKSHFAQRSRDYHQLVSRAEAGRLEAERGKQMVKERLAKLDASSAQVTSRARSEGEELRGRMIDEAKALVERLQQEAERTAGIEIEKAKAELRKELLGKAIASARDNLLKNLSSTEQKKLQNEFAEKIQVVGG